MAKVLMKGNEAIAEAAVRAGRMIHDPAGSGAVMNTVTSPPATAAIHAAPPALETVRL